MMGRQGGDQSQLFYLFNLERRIPSFHLLQPDQSGSNEDIGWPAREAGTLLQRHWSAID